MANQERGEIEIELEGRKCILRPTFEALCELEDRLGIGVPAIADKAAKMKIGIKEHAAIVYAGLLGSDSLEKRSFSDIGRMIRKQGMAKYTMACVRFLGQGLLGDPEEEPGALGESSKSA